MTDATAAVLSAPPSALAAVRSAPDTNLLARIAAPTLQAAAASWFVVAVLGQLFFVVYVVGFYGRAAAQGHWQDWNKVFPRGYVPGDRAGNFAIALHLALAVVILLGGALQLVPAVRQRWPRFHHWNGRIYLGAVALTSLAGLYMVWLRGSSTGDLSQHLGISLDAVLILIFAGLALRCAIARSIAAHRRWALRLFLTANAVWFFRIGLMAWIVANQGPVGFDEKTFTGPFLSFLSFADCLVPLAVLQMYFRAQGGGVALKFAMAAALALLTLVTAGGVAAATMIMWLPRL